MFTHLLIMASSVLQKTLGVVLRRGSVIVAGETMGPHKFPVGMEDIAQIIKSPTLQNLRSLTGEECYDQQLLWNGKSREKSPQKNQD